MKTILEYLINNHVKNKSCKQLELLDNVTEEEAEIINNIANDFFNYYKNTSVSYNGEEMSVEEFFNEYVGEDITNMFLVLAFMLAEDGDFNGWHKIGLKGYSGNNNPYDFGCFEEETDDNKTALEYIQDWLKANKNNEYKFAFVYSGINRNFGTFKNASTFLDDLIDILQ